MKKSQLNDKIKCIDCEETKPLTSFILNHKINIRCSDCRHSYHEKYRIAHREKINHQQKLKRQEMRKENKVLTKIPDKNSPDFIYLLNKFVSKNACNERKRKYVKYINIKNIKIDQLDLENKIVSFYIDNIEETSKIYPDFIKEFNLAATITNGFLLPNKIIGIYTDLVFLDYNYKEVLAEKIQGESVDVAGQIIVDYLDRHKSIIFLVKFVKIVK